MGEGMCSNVNGANETNHSWVVEIDTKLCNMESIPETELPSNTKRSIYRRPINVREEVDTFRYTPFIISFGPYHHNHKSCEQTNKIKESVLLHGLKRSGKTVAEYIKALSKVVQDLKDAYDELDQCWQKDDDAFLKLMIYDGCFFLEILHYAVSKAEEQKHLSHLFHQVLHIRRISMNELMEQFRHDMLLLENQLPLQLLVKLFAIQNNSSAAKEDLDKEHVQTAKEQLYKRILGFIVPSNLNIAEKLDKEHKILHVLDLYRHSLLHKKCSDSGDGDEITHQNSDQIPPDPDNILGLARYSIIGCVSVIIIPILIFIFLVAFVGGFIGGMILLPLKCLIRSKPPKNTYYIIPSATELSKVGIGFRVNKTKSLNDISFESGTLELPEICVDAATQSRFLNVIAFEELHTDAENHEVTSYIYFMSRLLKFGEDVRRLQLCSIIHTSLHNDQVAELFKSLAKDIEHDPKILLVETYRKASRSLTESFYRKMNNPWQRDLWQTYLKSPWAVISILAAFILFSLTSVQTAYTILSYYNQ